MRGYKGRRPGRRPPGAGVIESCPGSGFVFDPETWRIYNYKNEASQFCQGFEYGAYVPAPLAPWHAAPSPAKPTISCTRTLKEARKLAGCRTR